MNSRCPLAAPVADALLSSKNRSRASSSSHTETPPPTTAARTPPTACPRGPSRLEASRLRKHPKVSVRIEDLLEDALAAEPLTPEWVIRKLREEAQDHGPGSSHSARVRALEILVKFQGLLVDRQDVNVAHSIETPSLDALGAADIDALLTNVEAGRKALEGSVVVDGEDQDLDEVEREAAPAVGGAPRPA